MAPRAGLAKPGDGACPPPPASFFCSFFPSSREPLFPPSSKRIRPSVHTNEDAHARRGPAPAPALFSPSPPLSLPPPLTPPRPAPPLRSRDARRAGIRRGISGAARSLSLALSPRALSSSSSSWACAPFAPPVRADNTPPPLAPPCRAHPLNDNSTRPRCPAPPPPPPPAPRSISGAQTQTPFNRKPGVGGRGPGEQIAASFVVFLFWRFFLSDGGVLLSLACHLCASAGRIPKSERHSLYYSETSTCLFGPLMLCSKKNSTMKKNRGTFGAAPQKPRLKNRERAFPFRFFLSPLAAEMAASAERAPPSS